MESGRGGIAKQADPLPSELKGRRWDWETPGTGLGNAGAGLGNAGNGIEKRRERDWGKAGAGLESGRGGMAKQAEPLPSELKGRRRDWETPGTGMGNAGNGIGERAREKALHVVQGLLKSSRRLPIFPGRLQPSIVGV